MARKIIIAVLILIFAVAAAVFAQSIFIIENSPDAAVTQNELPESSALAEASPEVTAAFGSNLKENNKVIYLTFDDGPGEYTEKLLDILDKYDVKATFFVCGDKEEFYDLISREFKSGHSIGLHCMHHADYLMYSSEEKYFEDFEEIESLVYSLTGSMTDIMRFPGGSSNSVAEKYGTDMKSLIEKINAMGYTYFDWDASTEDATEDLTTKEVVSRLKLSVQDCKRFCLVLNHDTEETTVEAMDEFIPWALENGFVFKALTSKSPTVQHISAR